MLFPPDYVSKLITLSRKCSNLNDNLQNEDSCFQVSRLTSSSWKSLQFSSHWWTPSKRSLWSSKCCFTLWISASCWLSSSSVKSSKMKMQGRSTFSKSPALTGAKRSSEENLTAKVRREGLSLLGAEKALLPEHGHLRANGLNDAADVEQFELF